MVILDIIKMAWSNRNDTGLGRDDIMKALSLTQPMAWAIFHGKDIENRRWSTKFRGRVYIHASRSFDKGHYDFIAGRDVLLELDEPLPEPKDFVHGAIIGEVDIVSVVRAHSSPWFFGSYGFILRNAVAYDKPMPCKGALGFFEPDIK